MTAHLPTHLLRALIFRSGGRGRLWAAWAALTVGLTLLLLAVMVWWNFRQILQGRAGDDALGSTFLTVSKTVTDEAMGLGTKATAFTAAEIEALRKAPQVQDVGVLRPAAFKVSASLGGALQFQTLLFLESAPDRFMDRLPSRWGWKPGDASLPILLSRDFLNMYNYVFAPSQGLPQLTEATVQAIGFELEVGDGPTPELYRAQIVGFSDRISSVLVPQSFMDYGNANLAGPGKSAEPSRVILRAADPSDDAFVAYLKSHGLSTNAEQLRWNRARAAVQAVSAATGGLALVLVGIATLVFVLFIELTMARAQDAVRLLRQLGYSPRVLSRFLVRRFLPLLLGAVGAAMLLAAGAQVFAHFRLQALDLQVPPVPGLPVWGAAAVCAALLALPMRRAIRGALRTAV